MKEKTHQSQYIDIEFFYIYKNWTNLIRGKYVSVLLIMEEYIVHENEKSFNFNLS